MLSHVAPRRSARLAAEKPVAAVAISQPLPPAESTAPVNETACHLATVSSDLKGRPSSKRLLHAAQELRIACMNATTADDWAACHDFAHKLSDAAERAEKGDLAFTVDCAWWCGTVAADRQQYAVTSIDSYIESLQ